MIGLGTLVNAAAVLVGGTTGAVARRRFPERFRTTTTCVLGLVTFFLAVRMMIRIDAGYALHVVGALLAGAVIGEILKIEQRLERIGAWLRERAAGGAAGGGDFVEGFVVASLVFCVGPMTLLGTFEDGLGRPPLLLYVKSAMDGVMAIALAARYGRGVLCSVLVILVFQGALTAAAALGAPAIPECYVMAIEATGGVMVLGIGLLLLEVRRIRVANLLPALPLVCLLLWLWPNPLTV